MKFPNVGEKWKSLKCLPVPDSKMFECATATIYDVDRSDGETWVRFYYSDVTTFGVFGGRDVMLESDFLETFPTFVQKVFEADS